MQIELDNNSLLYGLLTITPRKMLSSILLNVIIMDERVHWNLKTFFLPFSPRKTDMFLSIHVRSFSWSFRICRLYICRRVSLFLIGPPTGRGWLSVMPDDEVLVVERSAGRLFAFYDTLVSWGGIPPSLCLFIPSCLRCPIREMQTGSIIFAPAAHEYRFVRGPHHKTVLCHILIWWDIQ